MKSSGSSNASKRPRARTRWHLFLVLHANPSLRQLRKRAQAQCIAERAVRDEREAGASRAAAANDGDVRLVVQGAVTSQSGEGATEHASLL